MSSFYFSLNLGHANETIERPDTANRGTLKGDLSIISNHLIP